MSKTVKNENPEQTVKLFVPKDGMNPGETHVRVGINGDFWTIQRTADPTQPVIVEVPVGVYEILRDAGYSPSIAL